MLLGSDGWMIAALAEESPGSTEPRCRVTPGEGNFRESATESKPPCRPRWSW